MYVRKSESLSDTSFPTVFAPQNCSLELLERTLTEDRRATAEKLLNDIEGGITRTAGRHHLLIGPVGSGKTHVLSYVRKKLEARHGAETAFKIVSLSEEDREMASLLDFFVAGLRSASPSAQKLISGIRSKRYEGRIRVARMLFEEIMGEHLTLVLVENLSDVFASMGREAQASLACFLQEHESISMCATSVGLPDGLTVPEHPFHDIFSLHSLGELDRRGARAYLASLALSRGDERLATAIRNTSARKRVDALYALTGGNHRLLAMLSWFLSAERLNELVGPFAQMADRQLIPYYEQQLNRLSPQQKKVVRLIAACRGRAVTVTELSRYALLSSQTVSRQLYDLLRAGYVARHQVGRESLYEIREPLFRLVLDIKEGRSGSLLSTIGFLRDWHQIQELREPEHTPCRNGQTCWRAALAALEAHTIEPGGDSSTQGAGASEESRETPIAPVKKLLQEGLDLEEEGRDLEALERFEQVVRTASEAGNGWLYKGLAFLKLHREEESLGVFGGGISRIGPAAQEGTSASAAVVAAFRAAALARLGRPEEAIDLYDEAVQGLNGITRLEVADTLAQSLAGKCAILEKLERYDEALVTYNDMAVRFWESDTPELQEWAALALIRMGILLMLLDRPHEAIATYDDVERKFGQSASPGLREWVVLALTNQAAALRKLGRYSEALDVLERAAGSRPCNVMVTCGKALALIALGREEEAAQLLRTTLATKPLSADERVLMAGLMLGALMENPAGPQTLVEAFSGDRQALMHGLIKWLQDRLSMSKLEAEILEEPENRLRSAFNGIEEGDLPLQVMRVLRRNALGDRKARLRLPVELRRLVQQ